MNTKHKHTMGNWEIAPNGAISAGGEVIILKDGFNNGFLMAENNRQFVCRACNSHDELVAALESCESILSAIECWQDKPMATGQILDAARAALAKARVYTEEQKARGE